MNGSVANDAYVRRESFVSIAINAVLSAAFFHLIFRNIDPIPVWGIGQWVFDFLPQSFVITLMSTLVPGALTAQKVKKGELVPCHRKSGLPGSLLARALLLAIMASFGGTALVSVVMLVSGIAMLDYAVAWSLKVAYGAALAAIVTPIGLRAALAKVDSLRP